MEIKPQTVIKMTVIKKKEYCPIFNEGDQIIIKKHCLDTNLNELEKYCYATLADIYPKCNELRKQPVGKKDYFTCRDNGIIEFELERMEDEPYDFERKKRIYDLQCVIREAISDDFEQLRDIYFQARKNDFQWVDPTTLKMSDFDKSVEGELILVALINNRIAGFVSIWEADHFIHNLFVDHYYRGCGIGKALIEESLRRSEKPMILKCAKENERALRFYQAMGWKIVKEEIGADGPYYVITSAFN